MATLSASLRAAMAVSMLPPIGMVVVACATDPILEGADYPIVHTVEMKIPFRTNAYVVEGRDSLVAVDGLLTVSAAEMLRERVVGLKKPLVGVLLTHGNPDHYGGVGVLTDGLDVPVISTAGVDRIVRRDDAVKNELMSGFYGDTWPSERRFPSQIVRDGESLDFGPDLRFKAIDIGPAESHHDAVFVLTSEPANVFVGDLVYSGTHSYLADGHLGEWSAVLAEFPDRFGDTTIYRPGHGEAGGTELFAAQVDYIDCFETAVQRADWSDPDAATEAVAAEMTDYIGNDDILFLLNVSSPAEAKRKGLLAP